MHKISSVPEYENFVYGLPNLYPEIRYSTLILKRLGRNVGEVSGTVFFQQDVRLNVKELIDFREECIKTYSYEVYHKRKKQYWYDEQPHPADPTPFVMVF